MIIIVYKIIYPHNYILLICVFSFSLYSNCLISTLQPLYLSTFIYRICFVSDQRQMMPQHPEGYIDPGNTTNAITHMVPPWWCQMCSYSKEHPWK